MDLMKMRNDLFSSIAGGTAWDKRNGTAWDKRRGGTAWD